MANTKYPLYGEFEIKPIDVEGFAAADGIYVNIRGEAFVGELHAVVDQDGDYIENTSGVGVLPYWDDDGDYIPAPANWRERIIRQVN